MLHVGALTIEWGLEGAGEIYGLTLQHSAVVDIDLEKNLKNKK